MLFYIFLQITTIDRGFFIEIGILLRDKSRYSKTWIQIIEDNNHFQF